MFQHILVPLDGSSRAEQAIPLAARIARASGARVVLARVITPLPEPTSLIAMGIPVVDARMQNEVDHEARKYLLQMKTAASLEGLNVTAILLHGANVAAELETYADNEHCDLIVLCSRGGSGLKRWFFGSVAQDLLRISAPPVLIVHEGSTVEMAERVTRPFSVLVALDGSLRAETALVPAAVLSAALSAPGQGRLHLLHIVRPALPGEDGEELSSQLDARALAEAIDYLDEVTWCVERGSLASYGLRVTRETVMEADIVHTLINVAEQGQTVTTIPPQSGYDALAITTHGRHGLPRWLQGSRAEYLLGATRLPLLVMRQPHEHMTDAEQLTTSLMDAADHDKRTVTGL